eukprot:816570-Pleurochrysis_carterae.AAC.1
MASDLEIQPFTTSPPAQSVSLSLLTSANLLKRALLLVALHLLLAELLQHHLFDERRRLKNVYIPRARVYVRASL